MKSIRSLVVAMTISMLPLVLVAGAQAKEFGLGQKAPMSDVKMKNATGEDVSIAGAAGKKGTLVIFICNHCPWVKAWQGRIASIGNAAVEHGVGVIAINSNDPGAYPEDGFDEMKERAQSVGYKFPYVVDATSEVGRAFGATHTPEAYLFDAKGKLVYHGAIDDNAREPDQVQHRWLNEAVDAVAAGKGVPTAETKALGCSIKLREKTSS
ncbi:MAG TPA: thioredoxin family protein [Candidatus Udaeobacter sp.]|jgi:hypothetical protein|nr:thioredoxin family protein [Candidatus Udaeobacter sp.]